MKIMDKDSLASDTRYLFAFLFKNHTDQHLFTVDRALMEERFNSIFRWIDIYACELLLISTSRRFYSRKDADLL